MEAYTNWLKMPLSICAKQLHDFLALSQTGWLQGDEKKALHLGNAITEAFTAFYQHRGDVSNAPVDRLDIAEWTQAASR